MSTKKTVLLVLAIGLIAGCAMGQGGARGKAEATVKSAKISIDYGRPSLGGQESRLGEAKDGMVWRLGANMSTSIETSSDLMVGGTLVKAGKYSLWAKKISGDNWHLCFHPSVGVWGAPELTSGYIAELPLKLEKASTSEDRLVISLADSKGKAAIKVQWGKDVLAGAFDVK